MAETLERAVQPAEKTAEAPEKCRRLGRLGKGFTCEIVHGADQMALALAEIDNGQFLSRFRQAHRRYRKIRIDLLDVADHGHLETQGLIRLRRIDDLEDGTPTIAAEM